MWKLLERRIQLNSTIIQNNQQLPPSQTVWERKFFIDYFHFLRMLYIFFETKVGLKTKADELFSTKFQVEEDIDKFYYAHIKKLLRYFYLS